MSGYRFFCIQCITAEQLCTCTLVQQVTKLCELKLNYINKNNRSTNNTNVLRTSDNIFSRILQKNTLPLATVVDNLHTNPKMSPRATLNWVVYSAGRFVRDRAANRRLSTWDTYNRNHFLPVRAFRANTLKQKRDSQLTPALELFNF